MTSSKLCSVAVATLFFAVAARAAHVDMTDPKRALGRDDDIRIDAALIQDTVSSGSPVGITYQIKNMTEQAIAVADKLCDISYDNESRTITLSVGSEPSHFTSAVGPYVGGTLRSIIRRYTVSCVR